MHRELDARGPRPTSSGLRIDHGRASALSPLWIRGSPHSHNAPGSQRRWALGQPLPEKFPLGTSSGGYYRPDSRPYGLWNCTTGGKAGPDRVITCGAGPMEEVEWTRRPKPEELRVGLISWAGSYLTFEAYKNTVTATAKGLGRRQVTR